ncbi:hypothetical protein R1sor_025736 [Riccia sorocarpa]|uniref:Uncharacterized protein n=1 Tax=Riccia sorocarpa TaxID=122646 RepID=A0ABD3G9Y6_9MARC
MASTLASEWTPFTTKLVGVEVTRISPEFWVDGTRWTFSKFVEYFQPFSKHSGDFSWTGIKVTDLHMEVQSMTAGDRHSNSPLKIELEWMVGPVKGSIRSKVHKVVMKTTYGKIM